MVKICRRVVSGFLWLQFGDPIYPATYRSICHRERLPLLLDLQVLFSTTVNWSIGRYMRMFYSLHKTEHSKWEKASNFITAGCSQNAAAFNSYVLLFLYRLAAAGR